MIGPGDNGDRAGGVVLIVVLWVLVALTAICLALNGWVRSQSWRAGRAGDDFRADAAVRSALAMARDLINADSADVDWLGDRWAGGDETAFIADVNGAAVILFTPVGADGRIGLSDEASRLNANTATAEMLGRLEGMTAEAAEAFVAARDQLAARLEASTPALTDPPRGPTGPIGSQTQLAAMLADALGPAAAGAAEPRVRAWDNPRRLSAPVVRLLTRLTIHSRLPNRDADGRPRVNLNTASVEMLTARLGDVLTVSQIQAIVEARQRRPLGGVGELLTRTLTVSVGDGGTVAAPVSVESFQAIVDRLTTTDEPILLGRVNVNTAEPEVLACLPGLSTAEIEAIEAFRAQADGARLRTVGWLLEVVSKNAFESIASHVTTRGAHFRVHIACQPIGPAAGVYVEAVLQRWGDGIGVLQLANFRQIWDDPRTEGAATASGRLGW